MTQLQALERTRPNTLSVQMPYHFMSITRTHREFALGLLLLALGGFPFLLWAFSCGRWWACTGQVAISKESRDGRKWDAHGESENTRPTSECGKSGAGYLQLPLRFVIVLIADLRSQSRSGDRRQRLSGRDHSLPNPVRVADHGDRQSPDSALQRYPTSDCG